MSRDLVQSMIARGLIRMPTVVTSLPRRAGRDIPKKLSEDQVQEIRRRWNTEERVVDIAHAYGISAGYVSKLGTGQKRSPAA